MSHEDYELADYFIRVILPNDKLTFDQRVKYIDAIVSLDLTKEESIKLCEYIDGVNSEYNILLNRCRTNVKKAAVVG